MRTLILVLACAVALTACGSNSKRATFDGKYFRAKLDRNRDAREEFAVRVRDAGKSLAGAREAGRYEATKYCIKTFGTSEVIWDQGPDVEDAELVISDGDLILRGRCKGW